MKAKHPYPAYPRIRPMMGSHPTSDSLSTIIRLFAASRNAMEFGTAAWSEWCADLSAAPWDSLSTYQLAPAWQWTWSENMDQLQWQFSVEFQCRGQLQMEAVLHRERSWSKSILMSLFFELNRSESSSSWNRLHAILIISESSDFTATGLEPTRNAVMSNNVDFYCCQSGTLLVVEWNLRFSRSYCRVDE